MRDFKRISPPIPVVVLGIALLGGCSSSPPPRDIPVPASPAPAYKADYAKPLPDQTAQNAPPTPAFYDPALVDQRLPEEPAFVAAYMHVNQPRLAVFVNRTLDGSVIGNRDVAIGSVESTAKSTGTVDVQHKTGSVNADPSQLNAQGDVSKFKSTGPAEYQEKSTVWLTPGQYDAADLQALDYAEIESLLTDWLHAGGQTTVMSPDGFRSHLTDEQVKSMQSGSMADLAAIGQASGTDVVIQVQAHPSRRQGQVVVVLIAEAINTRGGESIGEGSVEMPTPIDRIGLNNYTRFLARKLEHDMTGQWGSAVPAPATQPAPAVQP